jgi:hypothetical protein
VEEGSGGKESGLDLGVVAEGNVRRQAARWMVFYIFNNC